MNWTYGNSPLTSVRDEVRFLVGDTNARDPMISDDEIAYVLERYAGAALPAALEAARALFMRYCGEVDESVGPVSISFSQRKDGLRERIAMLEGRLGAELAVPYAGGISRADVRSVESNPDRVPPLFKRGSLQTPGLNAGDPRGYGGCSTDPLLGGMP